MERLIERGHAGSFYPSGLQFPTHSPSQDDNEGKSASSLFRSSSSIKTAFPCLD